MTGRPFILTNFSFLRIHSRILPKANKKAACIVAGGQVVSPEFTSERELYSQLTHREPEPTDHHQSPRRRLTHPLGRSGELKAVKVHYFVPHCYKIVHKLREGVLASVDFRQGPELGVRTED